MHEFHSNYCPLPRSAVPVLVAEMDKGNDQDGVPERGLARNQNYH